MSTALIALETRQRCLFGWALAAAATLTLLGCGGDFGSADGIDVSELKPVEDFVRRLQSAQPIEEVRFLDLGTPDARKWLVSGWGGDEMLPKNGTTIAWATAPVAEVEMVIFRTDKENLHFRCRAFSWKGAPEQRVSVTINGRPIGSVGLTNSYREYSLPIPRETLVFGLNRIAFQFTYAERARDHKPGSSGGRPLAAAFDFVGFTQEAPPGDAAKLKPVLPEIGEEGFVLRPETGLSFRFFQQGDVVLDFGLSAVGAGPSSSTTVVVWAWREGQPQPEMVMVRADEIDRHRKRIHIGTGVGQVELGFAAIGGENVPEGESRSVAVREPRLFFGASGARKISNVLLIVVDTLRADRVGAYGSEAATPNIDAIADHGVLFKRAFSHIPITGPSHSSLFTSLLPFEHGVRNNAQILHDGVGTMAEALGADGRNTAGVVSLGVLKDHFGLARGFDFYGGSFGNDWMKNAEEVNSEVFDLLNGGLFDPYFLWVHYSDPHEPYTPPDLKYPRIELEMDGKVVGEQFADGRGRKFELELSPGVNELRLVDHGPGSNRKYRLSGLRIVDRQIRLEMGEGWIEREKRRGKIDYQGSFPSSIELINPSDERLKVRLEMGCREVLGKRAVRERYIKEVEYVDRQIGHLLGVLMERGLLENTLVIFASDHGEGLGDHNHIGHISQLYDSLIHVPLIIAYPGHLQAGLVVEEPVALIDVLPTVVELLDLDFPGAMSGRSLVPALKGGTLEAAPVVAVTYRPEAYSEKRALIADGFKYIHSWHDSDDWEELYDLDSDPGELRDLASENPERLNLMRAFLESRLQAGDEAEIVEAELSEEEIERLRALGYIH